MDRRYAAHRSARPGPCAGTTDRGKGGINIARYYLTKQALLAEILAAKKRLRESNWPRTPAECMSGKFALMLDLLVKRYAGRKNWSGYTWIDDWKCDAILTLCQNWHKFDETKTDKNGNVNPFAYFTQIIHYSFLTSLDRERKFRDLKDEIAIANGLLPSWSTQEQWSSQHAHDAAAASGESRAGNGVLRTPQELRSDDEKLDM